MIYQIIAVVAIVIALAAILLYANLRHQLYTYVDMIDSDIRHLDKRMDNFADAKMLELKKERDAKAKV